MKKLLYTLLGMSLMTAGTVFAVQVSVPSGPLNNGGMLLQSLNNGNYNPVQLIAGSGITISSTTAAITISASGSSSGFSTTSANYWSTLGLGWATSSASNWLQNGAAFTTTTANTFTNGNIFQASTTIGSGTQAGGLTISGGSTTTGSAIFPNLSAGLAGIGSQNKLYSFASSSLFGYTPLNPTRQLTVAGTANQITSSAGAQDLSADRTWTLSLPNHVIFPSSFQVTTSSTTNATTTGSTYLTGITASRGVGVDANGKLYGAATTTYSTGLTYGGGAVTCDTASASVFGCLSAVKFSQFNSATTTFTWPLIYTGATNAVTWGGLSTSSAIAAGGAVLYATGVNTVASAATGTVSCSSGISCTSFSGIGGASSITNTGLLSITGAEPVFFTTTSGAVTTSFNRDWIVQGAGGYLAPTTTLGAIISASSTIRLLDSIFGTTTYATSTNIFATNASTTNFFGAGLSTCQSGNVLTYNGTGKFGCAADVQGSGAFPFTPTTFGATAANSTSTLIGFTQGIYSLASSTIGAGGQTTGLTISGGSTTTGAVFLTSLTSGTLNIDAVSKVYRSATSTATISSGLSYSGTWGSFIDGVSGNLTCATGSVSVFGCLTAANFATFNMKVATSASETRGQLAAWGTTAGSPATLYSVATTSITCSGFLTCTGFNALGAASTITTTGQLSIASGGTNASGLSNSSILTFNGTSIIGSSTPSASRFLATSTTLRSNFIGEFAIGSSTMTAGGMFGMSSSSPNSLRAIFKNAMVRPTATSSVEITFENASSTATTYFGNIGLNSPSNSDINFTIGTGHDMFAFPSDGSLLLGTATSSTSGALKFFTGGTLAANERGRFTSTGLFGIGTTTPTGLFSLGASGLTTPAFIVGSSTANYFGINNAGGILLNENRPATSTAITLNWAATGPTINYRIGNAATTITLINATTSLYVGSRKLVTICNGAETAGAVTWRGVEWAGAAVPTQTTTANVCDVWSFFITSATSSGTTFKVFGNQSANYQ